MELKLLLRNDLLWKVKVLGERALLLELESEKGSLEEIHKFSAQIEEANILGIIDLIPAYESLAIICDDRVGDLNSLVNRIEEFEYISTSSTKNCVHEIPVCYELGLDWDDIEYKLGLSRADIIERHTSKEYTLAMMGFIPGFVFLDGLEESLFCLRKASPRTKVPAGSVGIGGNQTGIYSLESPGGWNIIGRTPYSFFDIEKNPPTRLKAGDQIKFFPISESEFRGFNE